VTEGGDAAYSVIAALPPSVGYADISPARGEIGGRGNATGRDEPCPPLVILGPRAKDPFRAASTIIRLGKLTVWILGSGPQDDETRGWRLG